MITADRGRQMLQWAAKAKQFEGVVDASLHAAIATGSVKAHRVYVDACMDVVQAVAENYRRMGWTVAVKSTDGRAWESDPVWLEFTLEAK